MYNDWLKIGPLTIHGYGVMIAVGILFAFWLAEKLAKKHGLDPDGITSLIFFDIIFAYICSKLLYVLTVFDQFLADPVSVLGSGGWVVYGGIIGGIVGAWLYSKKKGWDVISVYNLMAVCMSLGQGFGRIGCFFAGCCYGVPTDSPIGVQFPADSLCPVGHPVIPTQLIMSAGDFLIFFILYRNYEKGKHPEKTAAIYLILYSLGRFLVEFIRGDIDRGFVGILSTSQFISVFVFIAGLWLYFKDGKNNPEQLVQ